MKIGIIGAGNVGGTLGKCWAECGHEVVFGVRDPSAVSENHAFTGQSRIATVAQAAAFGEVIALVVPWAAVPAVLQEAGDRDGKVVLDCTNPNFAADPDQASSGHRNSGAEQVAALVPGARLVKIFNTTGFENMANPHYGLETVTMFYAGNDEQAKSVASRLASDIGFETVDAGPLRFAHHLETLAELWASLPMDRASGAASHSASYAGELAPKSPQTLWSGNWNDLA